MLDTFIRPACLMFSVPQVLHAGDFCRYTAGAEKRHKKRPEGVQVLLVDFDVASLDRQECIAEMTRGPGKLPFSLWRM